MRVEIDPPVAGHPHAAAPLSRALEQTGALDIVDRPTAREPRAGTEWRGPDSALVGVSTTALGTDQMTTSATALLERAGPTLIEDLWSLPTGDIAALVADVLAQLTEVRRYG